MQRARPGGGDAPSSLLLQEALRTLGLGLEVAKVPRAELAIDGQGIAVETTTVYGRRVYSWSDLESQARAQQGHRRAQPRAAPWMDPAALTRWSVLLRIVGQLLDAHGTRACIIRAAPAPADDPPAFAVEATADERVLVDTEDVRMQLLRLRAQVDTRQTAAAAAALPRRPWWAIWRRN
jgi:hypothetical protein